MSPDHDWTYHDTTFVARNRRVVQRRLVPGVSPASGAARLFPDENSRRKVLPG